MDKVVKDIITSYNMGFLGASEVCFQFLDILRHFGADKALVEEINKELEPLARFLIDNFENHKCEYIENFQKLKKKYI